jgi:hypothetical protein
MTPKRHLTPIRSLLTRYRFLHYPDRPDQNGQLYHSGHGSGTQESGPSVNGEEEAKAFYLAVGLKPPRSNL